MSSTTAKLYEQAQEFEQAIRRAESKGPSANVDPAVHQAMIEAMRSEVRALNQRAASAILLADE